MANHTNDIKDALNTINTYIAAEVAPTPLILHTLGWITNGDLDPSEKQTVHLIKVVELLQGNVPVEVFDAAWELIQSYFYDNFYEQPNCYVPGLGWTVV